MLFIYSFVLHSAFPSTPNGIPFVTPLIQAEQIFIFPFNLSDKSHTVVDVIQWESERLIKIDLPEYHDVSLISGTPKIN